MRLTAYGVPFDILGEGHLEVYFDQSPTNQSWIPVCYHYFGSMEANIACRQLGYARSYNYGPVSAFE